MMGKTMKSERGAVLVLVALLLFVFIGVAALAVDLGHLYMVRNELQNAADAGALAGAANLYTIDAETNTVSVNPDANLAALQAATANRATAKHVEGGSNYLPVDVNTTAGVNLGDIQRGHWSFSSGFTENPSLEAISQEILWNSTFAELDANTALINAVRVTARRESNPASSFFARIFGYEEFFLSATAVAYLGFANTINPGEVDMPLAICRETIETNGELQCNFSRLINSSDKSDANTGGWTNYSQNTEYWPPDVQCKNPTTNEVAGLGSQPGLVCNGNPKPIVIGADMAVNGGAMEPVFAKLRDCWDNHINTNGYVPMQSTMMVVQCNSLSNPNGCLKTYPPVKVEIIWITPKNISGNIDKKYDDAPTQMQKSDGTMWSSNHSDGFERWKSFVQAFNLVNPEGNYAFNDYYEKTIYAKPNCEEVTPMGTTGGTNTGILAKIPVLVQ
jgi:Flp pilus assembly protein TadG